LSREPSFVIAMDVQNPLLGPAGATRIYGPQKGLCPDDMPHAENCLARLAEVVAQDLGIDAATEAGTGAAGGLGFGLRSFLNARLESGFKLFANYAGLESRIRSAQLVVTAEGAIDPSTLMGKGVGEVAALCRKYSIPCLGLAGTLALSEAERASDTDFTQFFGIAPELTDSETAKREPAHWLKKLAMEAAETWSKTH
jgi:glycerate 2-kinase